MQQQLERHVFAIRGEQASIKWGYHEAARLSGWSFAGTGSAGGAVTATVESRDAFRLTQAPLTLVLRMEGRIGGPVAVKWPVLHVAEQDGRTVLVTVGPCERTSRDG